MTFESPPQGGNIQSSFLNFFKEKQIPVTVYLNNGIGLKGTIENFDERAIFLTSKGRRQIIYKFNVVSIMPCVSVEKNETLSSTS